MPAYTVSTGNPSADSAYALYSTGPRASRGYSVPSSAGVGAGDAWTFGGAWQPNCPGIFPGFRCSAPPATPGGRANQIMLRNQNTPAVTRPAWDATEQACWTLISDGAALLTAVSSITFLTQTFDVWGNRTGGTVTWPDGATGVWARNGVRYDERTIAGISPGWDWKCTHKPPTAGFTPLYGLPVPLVTTVVQNQPDSAGAAQVPSLVLCLDEFGHET